MSGKRYKLLTAKVDSNKNYDATEATALVKTLASAKFDETVEVHARLGIDPRKSDQNVRGTVALPHGTGRTVRVLALTKGDGIPAAEGAGADFVGGDELIAKIADGWLDFDAVVATPDMMAAIGSKLGRILGPRGLLPNPKSGTVGINIGDLVKSLKAGQIEFRNDKTGVVHAPIGKASFDAAKIEENLKAFQVALEAAKPGAAKGVFVKSLYLTTTMGPSVKVTTAGLR